MLGGHHDCQRFGESARQRLGRSVKLDAHGTLSRQLCNAAITVRKAPQQRLIVQRPRHRLRQQLKQQAAGEGRRGARLARLSLRSELQRIQRLFHFFDRRGVASQERTDSSDNSTRLPSLSDGGLTVAPVFRARRPYPLDALGRERPSALAAVHPATPVGHRCSSARCAYPGLGAAPGSVVPIAGPVAFLEPATALKALASYNLLTGTSVKLGSILRYPRLSVSACS
jgi:hypothetical protein